MAMCSVQSEQSKVFTTSSAAHLEESQWRLQRGTGSRALSCILRLLCYTLLLQFTIKQRQKTRTEGIKQRNGVSRNWGQ